MVTIQLPRAMYISDSYFERSQYVLLCAEDLQRAVGTLSECGSCSTTGEDLYCNDCYFSDHTCEQDTYWCDGCGDEFSEPMCQSCSSGSCAYCGERGDGELYCEPCSKKCEWCEAEKECRTTGCRNSTNKGGTQPVAAGGAMSISENGDMELDEGIKVVFH